MATYYTYRRDVPLAAGQSLGFTAGKGYYARDEIAAGATQKPVYPSFGGGKMLLPDLKPSNAPPPSAAAIAVFRKKFAGAKKVPLTKRTGTTQLKTRKRPYVGRPSLLSQAASSFARPPRN